jgi:predicted ribosomally synthesized peptide with nif11-like leader
MEYHLPLLAMSEEQLKALLAKLKEDAGLQEKLKGAADLDAAVVIAKEAGFDVNKAELLNHQAKQTVALSDEDLEGVAGGCGGGSCGAYVTDFPTGHNRCTQKYSVRQCKTEGCG